MLKVTLRCRGQGMVWVSTNGSIIRTGKPAQPVRIIRGDEPVEVELEPSGSAISFVSYAYRPKQNGRAAFAHSGAAVLPLNELNQMQLNLNIDHRGVRAAGSVVEILKADMKVNVYPPLPSPTFDRRAYMRDLWANEKGYNGEMANALRAPWVAPAEMKEPLPFAAFLSGYNLVPYTQKWLLQLLEVGAGHMGLTLDEAQELAATAADNPQINWESDVGRKARALMWHVVSTVPNSFQYETDYVVSADGSTQLVESFDYMWQRGCIDCEDAGTGAHKIARAFQRTPGMGAFGRLMNLFTPTSFLGLVTQPSAGTGIRGEENPDLYGGHLWFCMLLTSALNKIRAGQPTPLIDSMVVIEGTGVAYGLPTLTPADQARIIRHKRIISMNPSLGSTGHEIQIANPHLSPDPPFQSLFYRDVLRIQFEVEPTVFTSETGPTKEIFWTQGASVVDLQRGYRGVTWENFLAGEFALDEYTADTREIIFQSMIAMERLVPEPTPKEMPYVPKAVPVVNGKAPAIFYLPKDMRLGKGKLSQLSAPANTRVQVEHENLGFDQIRTRLAFY